MPTYAIKQQWLPRDESIDAAIDRLKRQILDGHPVFIWREDGLLCFVCDDEGRELGSEAWLGRLILAAAEQTRNRLLFGG